MTLGHHQLDTTKVYNIIQHASGVGLEWQGPLPVAPEVAPVAPEVAPGAPEVIPVAPEVVPEVVPVAPVAPEVVPVAPEVVPEVVPVALVALEVILVAPEVALVKRLLLMAALIRLEEGMGAPLHCWHPACPLPPYLALETPPALGTRPAPVTLLVSHPRATHPGLVSPPRATLPGPVTPVGLVSPPQVTL
eukprot:CAMPEP_0119116640 /NCGR_PEP_ID=MMETSP1180-20130426/52397_1 /TAXON_ID=3052 ORGANISM="Chlamydomonas cf sp, Strain CCMP681" /NCGR_SAMPLE_ID=MMETSP1180 /ASSEMBLY_ACC=CAM_ASM_000741 /LENGTH=190 /DNA_ID=CAMNT_0007105813 /DNA_START=668 /DNA_END=1237 /DNA_ORIENTATION=-